MEKTTWKTIAIIFIALFILENLFITWTVLETNKEIEKTNVCYYDVCSEYPEAMYEYDLCTCYDYDLLGDLVVVKTEYMK